MTESNIQIKAESRTLAERYHFVDIAKALTMYSIVFGHSDTAEPVFYYLVIWTLPMFFFISGVIYRDNKGLAECIKRDFFTILVPYFCYSIISYLYWILIANRIGQGPTEIEWWVPLVGIFYGAPRGHFMEPYAPLWFLPCLFLIKLLYNAVIRHAETPRKIIILLLCVAIHFAWKCTFATLLPWSADKVLYYIVYFSLGCMLAEQIKKHELKIVFNIMILICLGAFHYLLFNWYPFQLMPWGDPLKIFEIFMWEISLAVTAIIALITLSKLLPAYKWILFYGNNTLLILCNHLFVIAVIKGFQVFILRIPLEVIRGNVLMNFLYSVIAMILLAPVIIITNRYFPFLTGKKRSFKELFSLR